MKLPVYLLGHPVLRQTAEPVAADYPDLKQLVADMYEAMYESEGVGLAAPQIGRSIRLVVIDASPAGETFPECAGRRMTLINPEVTVLDGPAVTRAEGCLSLPGISENVQRVEHIRLRWLDEDFASREEEISGYLARIVQHECDHLEGVVYTDHISGIRRQLIRRKLNDIVQGKVYPDYPVRFGPAARKH